MAKLTTVGRRQIRAALLDRFTAPRKLLLDKQEDTLAKDVLTEFIGTHIDLFKRLPEGWLPTAMEIYWNYKKHRCHASFLSSTKVPTGLAHGTEFDSEALYRRWVELNEAEKMFNAETSKLREQIDAVLYSASTEAKLLAAWPEVAPYLSKSAQIINLPAPRVGPLNKVLGLEAVAKAKA